MTKYNIGILALVVFVWVAPDVAHAQRTVGPVPIGPIWQMERPRLGPSFGEGVAISPDGKAVVYLGMQEGDKTENSLFLVELETGKETLLQAPSGSVMPMQPSFSPDGNQIAFVLTGPTASYSANIYTIGIDGRGLTKLTKSEFYTNKPAYGEPGYTGAMYPRYYYSPRYSPDGSRILFQVDDVVDQIRDFVAVMKPDGSDLQVLAEGRPCCWSADGKSVYYSQRGVLARMDLASRTTRTVLMPALDSKRIIGRMKGVEWFSFYHGEGKIGWYTFETATPGVDLIGEWSVPGAKMVGSEVLTLKGFDWSDGYEVLLWYQGEETERFEVVRIATPTTVSR